MERVWAREAIWQWDSGGRTLAEAWSRARARMSSMRELCEKTRTRWPSCAAGAGGSVQGSRGSRGHAHSKRQGPHGARCVGKRRATSTRRGTR